MTVSGSDPAHRLWTLPFLGVMLLNGFITLNFLLLMSYMTGFAIQQFGVDGTDAGLAAGIFVIGALASRVFIGKYTDLVGRKRMLVVCAILLFLGSLGYFVAFDFWVLILVRFVQGAAFGAVSNIVTTIAMGMIPTERRGEGVGWFTLSMTLGQALGPALGVWMVAFGDPNQVFLFGAALCFAAALAAVCIPVREPTLTATDRSELRSWRLNRILAPTAIPMGFIVFLLVLPYAGLLTFMTGYAEEVHLLSLASVFFLVYAGTVTIGRPLAGLLLDRFSDNSVVLPSFIPYVIALVLLALDLGAVGYLASAVLVGLGYGTLNPVLQAVAVRETPTPRTSMAVSTYYIGLDSGMGLGPVLLGAIIGAGLAFRSLFGLLAVWVVVVAVIYVLLYGRKASARVQPRKSSSRE